MKSLWEMLGEHSGGPSGYTSAFTRPDPMDPNDRLRQKTQSRGDVYPYDKPIMYGRSSHAGMDGSERQDGADNGPPLARQHKPPRPMTVWDRMSDLADSLTRESAIGSGYESEVDLGLGNHGRMGEDGMDAIDLELDALKKEFSASYEAARTKTDRMSPKDLFTLLGQLDPDFSAETFAPEDQDEMRDIYGCWAGRVIGREE